MVYLVAKELNLPVSSTPVEHIFTQNGIIYSKSLKASWNIHVRQTIVSTIFWSPIYKMFIIYDYTDNWKRQSASVDEIQQIINYHFLS